MFKRSIAGIIIGAIIEFTSFMFAPNPKKPTRHTMTNKFRYNMKRFSIDVLKL